MNTKREIKPENSSIKIQTKNLNAWFGSNQVLKEISMSIYEKKATAVIGPSGCGKSTFIRCLNRMHEVIPGASANGQVLLDGFNIYESTVNPVQLRKCVGMVFQKPNPFPVMTIKENVLAGLRLQQVKKKDMDEVVEKALCSAALWNEVKDILDRPGLSLSGGQQQ